MDTLGATIGDMEYGIGHLGVALAQIGGKTRRIRLPVRRIKRLELTNEIRHLFAHRALQDVGLDLLHDAERGAHRHAATLDLCGHKRRAIVDEGVEVPRREQMFCQGSGLNVVCLIRVL